ncbi:hypothetical protein A3H22_00360 [Candidatus Peribacteria bacterium RIFCSPLOWO2_12_FULL_55_15]|nr:MAG: hypothetical protein A2789_02465 [Candidatus Peribacteria bacterium RIFCSPHIGHO2_01_FULL_54_22]OGJ63364.1 MAG: hypothetical protein A3D12_00340 [Candidatus Peribacteria bacterium RIFCSPHIGHO2_02_FULL_55_24]OGJ64641.1 MAG: hypothetical protein A3E47_01945 [Candidatus Peribacteria bacterium RIFCSPHIGHO2_12_FULL_54_10]OGJ68223.1 MAG: hypothetical protein A2947_01880 [Candidatus Peribacteria bacterium RIFCSPLOWO2_01_FULL_54_110]OGJ69732.1 MAG: hypothetical protein A3H90_01545 [Candidatus Pe
MFSLLPTLDAFLGVLSDDPAARVFQLSVLCLGIFSVYLLFYTTRDVLIRSSSISLQLFSIFLVALLPVAGFFLYLLFRPSRTIAEREMTEMLRTLARGLRSAAAIRGVAKAVRSVESRREKEASIPSRA